MTSPSDACMGRLKNWPDEGLRLREIIQTFSLAEEVKWGWPCYSMDKSNVVLIHAFKEYIAVLFFKGALMSDPDHVLQRIGQNTQAGRQFRFKSLQEIEKLEPTLRAYVSEAIELEKSGQKVVYDQNRELNFPDELLAKFDKDPSFKAAFEALTPGRQRAYNFHFSAPKQSKTRETRIEKCVPQILKGKGLNE